MRQMGAGRASCMRDRPLRIKKRFEPVFAREKVKEKCLSPVGAAAMQLLRGIEGRAEADGASVLRLIFWGAGEERAQARYSGAC